MIVCPVCEHPQAHGAECDSCGKQLAPSAATAVPVAPMPELQQTRVVASERLNVVVQPLAELELTRQQAAPELPVQRVADLETTSVPKVAAVATSPVPELDTGRAPDDGQRTAAPVGAVTCRYCRNVQASGALCDKCGMRLPKVALAAAGAPGAPDEWTVCSDCGARAHAGKRCPSCGARVAGEAE